MLKIDKNGEIRVRRFKILIYSWKALSGFCKCSFIQRDKLYNWLEFWEKIIDFWPFFYFLKFLTQLIQKWSKINYFLPNFQPIIELFPFNKTALAESPLRPLNLFLYFKKIKVRSHGGGAPKWRDFQNFLFHEISSNRIAGDQLFWLCMGHCTRSPQAWLELISWNEIAQNFLNFIFIKS